MGGFGSLLGGVGGFLLGGPVGGLLGLGLGTVADGAMGGGSGASAPPPRNLGNELDTILGRVNSFAGANYNAQSQYNPQLTQLNLANYRQAILGTPSAGAQYDFSKDSDFAWMLPEYQRVQGQGDTRSFNQWLQGWVSDPANAAGAASVSKLMQQKQQAFENTPTSNGAAMMTRQAYDAVNPELVNYTKGLQAVMDRLNAAAPNGITPAGYDAATASPVLAPATRANGGPLLNPLQRDAAANLGAVSPIQSRLNRQAMSLLNTDGGLTQGELQSAQDSARSAYADRGLLRSNTGIGAEILSTDAARRQRLLENAQFAAGIDASNQSQLNQNRGYALNVQGQGQNLSTTNAGLLTNASLFNANQANNMGQFNALQRNQAGAFNAAATNNINQYNANLTAQNLNDAWSRAMQYGGMQISQAQNPLALSGAVVGQTPDYTQSLLGYGSDLFNTNYNAAAAANISSANNKAAMNSSLMQGGTQLASAKLMFMCIPEGQRIDTPGGGVSIENIRPGMRVIGYDGFPVFVVQAHAYMEDPAAKRFVCLHFAGTDHTLTVCDMHRIEGRRAGEIRKGDRVGDRTVAAITVHGGVRRSYDLLTADAGYRIHGVPVNSMIEEMAAAAAAGKE